MESDGKPLRDVLDLGHRYLEEQGVTEARVKCEMLLSRLLGVPRLELHVHRDQLLRQTKLEAMRRGLKRLRDGEPVQHVLGETGFMDHVFKTDRRALIPRPETEVLVRRVLEDPSVWAADRPCIVDVGTGSGCIVLSLAAARPAARYLAVDVSEEALALAKENAQRLGLHEHVIFYSGDLGDVVEPEMLDAIVANLPYIPSDELATLERSVREYEPHLALDGGMSGLDLITNLIADAAIVLKPHGKIFLEIGSEQGGAVSRLLQESGFGDIELLQDLQGRDRVVCGILAMS